MCSLGRYSRGWINRKKVNLKELGFFATLLLECIAICAELSVLILSQNREMIVRDIVVV